MTDREQTSRSEAAILQVFDNQFPSLTNQLVDNLYRVSMVGEWWTTKLLLFLGTGMLGAALALKLLMYTDYPARNPDGIKVPFLNAVEFTTLVLAASGLLFVGAVFSLIHAWGWRSVIRVQQAAGVELLKRQVDIEKELLVGKHRQQAGELIVLPAKIRKRHRR